MLNREYVKSKKHDRECVLLMEVYTLFSQKVLQILKKSKRTTTDLPNYNEIFYKAGMSYMTVNIYSSNLNNQKTT